MNSKIDNIILSGLFLQGGRHDVRSISHTQPTLKASRVLLQPILLTIASRIHQKMELAQIQNVKLWERAF
jgi:hypothetical protein